MSGARRAVIVGINEYLDKDIANLSGAVNDATDICHILRNNGQFVIDDEHFLIDKNATSERVRSAISDLFWKSDEEIAVALFYFAGHGRRDHFEHGYLLPHDVDSSAPFVKGIRIQELRELFRYSEPKNTAILILDCCYSGLAVDRGPGGDEWTRKFHDELRLDENATGRFILASADADKTAREIECCHALDESPHSHTHGLYSFHLIEGLRGAIKNEYGQVSLGDLNAYIDRVLGGDKNRPRHSFVGSGEHHIVLATIEEEMRKQLCKRIGELRAHISQMVEQKDPKAMMVSIQKFNELQRLGVANEELTVLEKDVAGFIEESSNIFGKWWMDNDLDIYSATDASEWHRLLNDIMNDFRLEKIRQLKKGQMSFLSQVMERIAANKNAAEVINLIKRLDRDRTQIKVAINHGFEP